ncbi:MAG TPA: serine/threonine-protein kinase [Actinomycetota bacterium]|nr:serine/threonine-protein kinase [Actinomycetota bacterium]
MAELPAGSVLGNYRVDWLIGRGGMGAVYLAQHVRMSNRKAALKVLSPELAGDPEFRERFIRESDLAGSLEHPNIVPVYDAGEADGVLYCVMRYVRGTDLGAVLDLEGKLTPARTYAILAAVGRALDFAHAHGLLHRDVKPGNIMLESRRSLGGGRERVFLTDFGLVKRLESNTKLTRTGHLVGTLDYTAPEVFRGEELDARADVYSLGCVLYECLTGAVPFPGSTDAAVMYGHLQEPPPTVTDERPELPPEIDRVARRAMAKHRSDRYSTAGDLVRAVRDALGETGPVVVPIGDAPSLRPARESGPDPEEVDETLAAMPPPMRVVPVTTRDERHAGADDAPDEPLRRWGRRQVLALGLAVAMLGTAVASAIAVFTGNANPPPAGSNPVVATVDVGPRPLAVAFGDGSAWGVSTADGTLTRIDPADNTAVVTLSVGNGPQGVVEAGDRVWVADTGDDRVTVIDAPTNRVLASIAVGGTPEGMTAGAGAVWVTNAADNSVSRIDTTVGKVIDTIAVGPGPVAATFANGFVWVANQGNDTVARINPGDDQVTGTFPVPAGASSIAFGEGSIWVANGGARHGFVTRLNSRNGRHQATIAVGSSPFGLVFADGSLWVGQVFDGVVLRIDPSTNVIADAVAVGGSVGAIAFGDNDLWVTRGDGTVARVRP